MNLGNIELLEKDGDTYCPKCETEVIEIHNKRLTDILHSITNAYNKLNESKVRSNAQELIKHAKTIEAGERKLKAQLMRKEKQLKELHYEIAIIENVAKRLNYNL